MERAIEIFAVINFTILGLHHLLRPRASAEFVTWLHSQGRAGACLNGFFPLIGGSLIVSFHNVWTGIPAVLTVVGWGFVLKATIVFLNPDWGLRSLGRVTPENAHLFRLPGAVFLALAALLGYELWTTA